MAFSVKMSCVKVLTSLAVRAFSTRRRISKRVPNPGIENRLDMLREDAESDFELKEEFGEFEEECEPDFMQVHRSYSDHQRELLVNKDKLKQRIVARKYFKDTPVSFLTFTEKEQIRILHEKDPTEWTPEKLSESFPVLPDVIRKILKAKWLPRSVDNVLKHDQHVIENWSKFKSGGLSLDPKLKQHLAKFKDRKITMPCREELAQKIVETPFDFPKPRSRLFSSIVKDHEEKKLADETSRTSDTNKLIAAKDDQKKIVAGESMKPEYSTLSITEQMLLPNDKTHQSGTERENDTFFRNTTSKSRNRRDDDSVTLDKYIEDTMDNMKKGPTEQDIVFMDVYKKRKELQAAEDKNQNATTVELMPREAEKDDQTAVEMVQSYMTALQMARVEEDTTDKRLSTYIKEWRKNEDKEADEEYPTYIEIPRKKFKEGMMYRVGDCYYDDDGEFLYRVPGIQN